MAKTSIKKAISSSTLPTRGRAARIDSTSTGIPGTRLRARRGRSARNARMTEKLPVGGEGLAAGRLSDRSGRELARRVAGVM